MAKSSTTLSKKDSSTTKAPIGVPAKKRNVYIHVTFVKLGDINTVRETFDAEIIVTSRWRAPTLDGKGHVSLDGQWNPNIHIENATEDQTPKAFLSVDRTVPNETFLVEKKRFRGSYAEVMELWDFPFDVQELSILIKADASIKDTMLVDETREMHKVHKRSFADEQEFYIYQHITSSIPPLAVDAATGIVKQKKPLLKLTVNVARRTPFYIRLLLLVNIIILLGFTSFGIDSSLLPNRLQVCFVLVLAAVTLKNLVINHVSKISYFTYVDTYMLTMLIILAFISSWHGFMTQIADEYLHTIDKIGLVGLAIVYVIFHAWFVGHVLLKPFRRRREMDRKQLDYQNKYSEQLNLKTKKTQPEHKSDV